LTRIIELTLHSYESQRKTRTQQPKRGGTLRVRTVLSLSVPGFIQHQSCISFSMSHPQPHLLFFSQLSGGASRDAVASPSSSAVSVVDEVEFAQPVSLQLLRIVHTPRAAAVSSSKSHQVRAGKALNGQTWPLAFDLDVWALQAAEGSALARNGASIKEPWLHPLNSFAAGWRNIFPKQRCQIDESDQSIDAGMVLQLQQPKPTAARAQSSSPGHAGNSPIGSHSRHFRTVRILLRGTYQQLAVALYGQVLPAEHAPTKQITVLRKSELQHLLRAQDQLKSSTQQVAQQKKAQRQRELGYHSCFEHLFASHNNAILTKLLSTQRDHADMAHMSRWSRNMQPLSLADEKTNLEKSFNEAFQQLLAQLSIQIQGEVGPGFPASLAPLLAQGGQLARVLPSWQLGELYSAFRSQLAGGERQLTSHLSFLLATWTPRSKWQQLERSSGSGPSSDCFRFMRSFPSTLPISFVRSVSQLLSDLLAASPIAAVDFVEQGAGMWWILAWMQTETPAPNSSPFFDTFHHRTAVQLLSSLASHAQTFESIDSTTELLAGTGSAASKLMQYGIMTARVQKLPGEENSAVSLAFRRLQLQAQEKVLLHLRCRQLHMAFEQATAAAPQIASAAPVLPQLTFIVNAFLRVLSVLRDAGLSCGFASPHFRSLSSSFLSHVESMKLLDHLSWLLKQREHAPHLACMEPRRILYSLVQPTLLFALAGKHCTPNQVFQIGVRAHTIRELIGTMVQMGSKDDDDFQNEARRLQEWIDARFLAFWLLYHGSSDTEEMRLTAWSTLAHFTRIHPFGVDATAAAMRDGGYDLFHLFKEVFASPSEGEILVQQQYAAFVLHSLLKSNRGASFLANDKLSLPPPAQIIAMVKAQQAKSLELSSVVTIRSDPAFEADQKELLAAAVIATSELSAAAGDLRIPSLCKQLESQISLFLQRKPDEGVLSSGGFTGLCMLLSHLQRIVSGPTESKFSSTAVTAESVVEQSRIATQQAVNHRSIFNWVLNRSEPPPTSARDPGRPGIHEQLSALLVFLTRALESQTSNRAPSPSTPRSTPTANISPPRQTPSEAAFGDEQLIRTCCMLLDPLLGLISAVLTQLCTAFVAEFGKKRSDTQTGASTSGTPPQASSIASDSEEGEVREIGMDVESTGESSVPNTANVLPLPLVNMTVLHTILLNLHRALAAQPVLQHYFTGVEIDNVEDTQYDAILQVPSPFQSHLGFMPRLRDHLYACLSHTIWSVLDSRQQNPGERPPSIEDYTCR
jgi:hypothetical protein